MERRVTEDLLAARTAGELAGRRLDAGTRAVSAVRPEPVQVQANNGRPARFVWRERLYTVISVVERPGERSTLAQVPGEPDSAPNEDEPNEHGHRPTEWRCWLVTASPGRNVPSSAFRLCHDPVTDRWQLTRDGS